MQSETRTANRARLESSAEHVWFWPAIVTPVNLCSTRSTPVAEAGEGLEAVAARVAAALALVAATEVVEPAGREGAALEVAAVKVEPVGVPVRVGEEAGAEGARARLTRITTTIQ